MLRDRERRYEQKNSDKYPWHPVFLQGSGIPVI